MNHPRCLPLALSLSLLAMVACDNSDDPSGNAGAGAGAAGASGGAAGQAGNTQESANTSGFGGAAGAAGGATTAFCHSYCEARFAADCPVMGSIALCEQTCPEIDPACAAWQQFQACAAPGIVFTCGSGGKPVPTSCAGSFEAMGECSMTHVLGPQGGSGGAAGSG